MDALGGAAGEEEAGLHAHGFGPQGLSRGDGVVGLGIEEVPGGGVLGDVQMGGPEVQPRGGVAVVAGHIQAGEGLVGQLHQAVVEGGHRDHILGKMNNEK